MNILLIGNNSCGNRGDCAILRGLIEEIRAQCPIASLVITSRYPVSSGYLLGECLLEDPLNSWHKNLSKRKFGGFREKLAKRLIPFLLAVSVKYENKFISKFLPRDYQKTIEWMSSFDAVVQVGGSNFVDIYGLSHFELTFSALLAGRPLYLLGQSMGPFNGTLFRYFSKVLVENASQIALREPSSKNHLSSVGLLGANVTPGGDTAWLVSSHPEQVSSRNDCLNVSDPIVAVTFRELAPFDVRLGITQNDYEKCFARIIDKLIDKGFNVVAVSTCTGIDSYHRDDRIVALRVRELVKDKSKFSVLMNELNDMEIGYVLQKCRFLIGTRLHSAIISMNFGTPAIVINYEHKSEGIMRQMGLDKYAHPVSSVIDGSIIKSIFDLDAEIESVRLKVTSVVKDEKIRTKDMVRNFLMSLSSKSSA